MVSLSYQNLPAQREFKFVQSHIELPRTALTLENLKCVEESLTKRGLLPSSISLPLWFLAETERNVFLWKHGLSLVNVEEFVFWIDVASLVDKRSQSCRTE